MPTFTESFESPESSTIVRAGYDPLEEVLQVTLRKKATDIDYEYAGVPLALWEEFDAAVSKGAFFNSHIRPLYNGRKL